MRASDTLKMSTSSRSAKARRSSSGPSNTGVEIGRRGPAIGGSIRSVSLPQVDFDLFHRDERPAPPELVAQAAGKVLGWTEADHLQPSRMRAASQCVACGDRTAAATAVDAHLGRAA